MHNRNKKNQDVYKTGTGELLDKLTGEHYTEQHPLVRVNLLELLYQNIPVSQVILIIGALVSTTIYYQHAPSLMLFSWLGIVTTIALIRIVLARRFPRTGTAIDNLDRAYLIFNFWSVAMGLAWGLACILLPPADQLLLVGFSVMVLLAIGGGAVVTLVAAPRTFMLFIVACYGPPVVWLMATRPLEQQLLAALLVIHSGFLLAIASRQHPMFLRNIILKLHNESLVKHLRRDVVNEQNIRNQLEENEDRLRDLFDNASDLIFVIYVDGTFAYVNRKWKDTLGYSETDLKKLRYEDIVHPDHKEAAKKNLDIIYSGKAITVESVLIARDGRHIDVIGTVNCKLMNGRPYQIRCIYKDITDVKKTSSMLESAQKKYQNIVNNALDMIFTSDSNGNFTFVNRVSADITGYGTDELIGMNYLELVEPEYREKTGDFFARQLERRIPESSYLFPIKTRNGAIKWIQQNTQMLFEDGQPAGFQAVARDMSDRIQIEDELRHARDDAENSRMAEERFIASVSHEIRTPMNAVVGLIDLMSKTELSSPQQEYLRSLEQSSGRLLKIVNDLLEFKRIQAGKIEFINSAFSLRDILHQQISIFSNQASLKGIEFSFDVDASIPDSLVGDEARLSQILQNLISNAIKYTELGYVKIQVATEKMENRAILLKFSVTDTGVGIPRGKLAHIFDAYQQVDARRDSFKGSGMGLAIFKSLVELQGGHIAVESNPGRGSTFTFWLNFSPGQESGLTEPEADMGSLLRNMKPFSILLVDDDAMNIYVALKFLEGFDNIDVTTADDGKKAINAFSQSNYDIIMTDINMPVMDGYEMARRIRHDFTSHKSRVRIVALTAELTPHEELRAAGIDDYLLKPFTREALYKKIYETLAVK